MHLLNPLFIISNSNIWEENLKASVKISIDSDIKFKGLAQSKS